MFTHTYIHSPLWMHTLYLWASPRDWVQQIDPTCLENNEVTTDTSLSTFTEEHSAFKPWYPAARVTEAGRWPMSQHVWMTSSSHPSALGMNPRLNHTMSTQNSRCAIIVVAALPHHGRLFVHYADRTQHAFCIPPESLRRDRAPRRVF
jgi:hypothetical protein